MNRSDENGLCFIAKPFSVVPRLDVVVTVEMVAVVPGLDVVVMVEMVAVVVEMVAVVVEMVAVVVEMVAVVVEMVAVVVEMVAVVIEVVGVEETAALVRKIFVVAVDIVVSSTIRLHCAGGKSSYSGNFGRNIVA